MVVSKQLYFLTLLFTNNGFETLSTRGTLKGRSKLQGTSLFIFVQTNLCVCV